MDDLPKNQKSAEREEKQHKKSIFAALAVICIAIFIVILLYILLRGRTTVSGQYPDDVSDVSLSCESSALFYPFFDYDGSEKKSLRISSVFHGDTIRNISLIYTLYYSDLNASIASEAMNHAAMNSHFSDDGFSPDSFSITYSESSERMQTTMYATAADFEKYRSKKYFLIDDVLSLESVEDYKFMYENLGFTCQVSE